GSTGERPQKATAARRSRNGRKEAQEKDGQLARPSEVLGQPRERLDRFSPKATLHRSSGPALRDVETSDRPRRGGRTMGCEAILERKNRPTTLESFVQWRRPSRSAFC